jgi:WD40 repeat protein
MQNALHKQRRLVMKKSAQLLVLALTVTLAAFSQKPLTIQQALLKLLKVQGQYITKGEFETSKEFEARLQKFLMLQEQQVDELITKTYSGDGIVNVMSYNADQEMYPVSVAIEGCLTSQFILRVPRTEAKYVKEKSINAMATGRFWMERDAKVYPIGSLNVKIGGREYRTELGDIRIAVTKTIPIEIPTNEGGATSAAFSPDGRFLAIERDRSCHIFDVSDPAKIVKLYAVGALQNQPILFSKDGKMLIVVENGKINLREPASGTSIRTINTNNYSVRTISLSPDGITLAAILGVGFPVPYFQDVVLWSTQTGQQIQKISFPQQITNLCFPPSGDTLVIGSQNIISYYAQNGENSYVEIRKVFVNQPLLAQRLTQS